MNATQTMRAFLATALGAVLAGPPLGADTLTRSLPVSQGQSVSIELDTGHIQVRTGEPGRLTVTVASDANKVDDIIALTVEEKRGGVRVAGNRKGSGGGWFSSKLKLVVDAPPGLSFDMRTGSGDIEIDAMEADIIAHTSDGGITFGSITGEMQATTSDGHIRGGRITEGGRLHSADGDLHVAGAGSALSLSTSGGDVSVGDVDGELTIHTSGGHVKAGRVKGTMELRTSGGRIEAAGCGGGAVAHTAGGDIVLREMRGHVKASTSEGDVSVSIAAGNASGADLSSGNGSILLHIPAGIGFELNAMASGSSVVAEVQGLAASSGKESLSGKIGSGGNLLHLRTRHDTIRIIQGGSSTP